MCFIKKGSPRPDPTRLIWVFFWPKPAPSCLLCHLHPILSLPPLNSSRLLSTHCQIAVDSTVQSVADILVSLSVTFWLCLHSNLGSPRPLQCWFSSEALAPRASEPRCHPPACVPPASTPPWTFRASSHQCVFSSHSYHASWPHSLSLHLCLLHPCPCWAATDSAVSPATSAATTSLSQQLLPLRSTWVCLIHSF